MASMRIADRAAHAPFCSLAAVLRPDELREARRHS